MGRTAYAIAFDPEERFLMVWHPRRNGWEMPGGHVEPGETSPEAAAREFIEESGYRIRIVAARDIGYCDVCAAVLGDRVSDAPEMESRMFSELPGRLSFDREEYLDTVPWALGEVRASKVRRATLFNRSDHPSVMSPPFRLAIYGKGGIGKSTVSANLSSCLGSRGHRVMQVGCDPKHDSTRLLLGGRAQRTVLDAVRSSDGPVEADDVCETGENGVLCLEAGGPRPGVGCGGRGVLTAFDEISRLGIGGDADIRIFDVLGDVVCGGFAVPMREENSDAVAIVTSGEFMSVYAANNIMRGLRNFGRDRPRLLGLIYNSRGDDDPDLVERLSEATGAHVIARIPRSRAFAEAEAAGRTAVSMLPGSDAALAVRSLADLVEDAAAGRVPLHSPHPLDDEGLGVLAAGGAPVPSDAVPAKKACPGCLFHRRGIVASCSPAGALAVMNRVKDVEILLHGPRNCGFVMSYAQNSEYIHGSSTRVYPRTPLTEHVSTTGMDDSDSIFGGAAMLEERLEERVATGRPVAVIGTCVSGIIGEDTADVIGRVRARHPGAEIMYVPTEGAVSGNKWEGYDGAMRNLADLIEECGDPDPDLVNIVCHTFKRFNGTVFSSAVGSLLTSLGLRINTRFVDVCTTADIRRAGRASMDLMLYDDRETRVIASMLEEKGLRTFPLPVPVGMRDTREWISEMGRTIGRDDLAQAALEELDRQHGLAMQGFGSRFEGRRAAVFCSLRNDAGWMRGTLEDLGADVVRVFESPAVDRADDMPLGIGVTMESSRRAVLEACEEEGIDLLVTDRRIPGTRIPQIAMARSSMDPFDYAETARMLWLQTRSPGSAGWRGYV